MTLSHCFIPSQQPKLELKLFYQLVLGWAVTIHCSQQPRFNRNIVRLFLSSPVGSTPGSSGCWNQGFCVTPASPNCVGEDAGEEKSGEADTGASRKVEGEPLVLRAVLLSCAAQLQNMAWSQHSASTTQSLWDEGNMPQLCSSSAFPDCVCGTPSMFFHLPVCKIWS